MLHDVRRAERGMPRERQLAGRGEDPHPRLAVRPRGRQQERGLGTVHLARDRLHLRVGEARRLKHHRERIASEDALGEDVHLDEEELPGGHG